MTQSKQPDTRGPFPHDDRDHRRETDEPRRTPPSEQQGQANQSGDGTPGDLGAPDIVGPFGEEMPVQSHDDVGD